MKSITKKISALIIIVLVSSIFSIAAFADEPVKVNVDNKPLDSDIQPQIVDGRTMVPLRAILEALGLELKWVGPRPTARL